MDATAIGTGVGATLVVFDRDEWHAMNRAQHIVTVTIMQTYNHHVMCSWTLVMSAVAGVLVGDGE